MDTVIKPKIKVYFDEFDANATHLFEKFSKEKGPPDLLQKASIEIAKSSNPESAKLTTMFHAIYLREKGIKEPSDETARKLLLKSLTEFKKIIPENDLIIKRVELEFLKRKLSNNKRPDLNLFLRRAKIFKEIGEENGYNQDMALYYMFSVMDKSDSLSSEEVNKQADLMLEHSQKGLNEELYLKMKGLYHQIRASAVRNPLERSKELQKAVSAIKKTSDKYGIEGVETEALMAKAMSTVNEKKRNTILSKVAENYKKRGLKDREDFVRKLIYPVPVKAAKIIYLCDKSIEKVKEIERKLVGLKTHSGPAAVFYHIGYLMERIKDINRLMVRMAITRNTLRNLQIEINTLTPSKIIPGKPLPKKMQLVDSKNNNLREQMRQDMESLFIYGNLLLDQWSYVISYVAGYEVPATDKEISGIKPHLNFAGLLNLLQAKKYKGELLEFWNKHNKDIIWLSFHLRDYRNVFIEHMRKPWQRGTTMASYGDDFNFFIPSPIGYVPESDRKRILEDLFELAPKKLKDMPDDYWEKKNLHRALEVTLYYIDEIENQSDREKVGEAWKVLGGSAPSYDTIGLRLLNYVYSSLDTIINYIDKYPKSVKFGEFKKI